MARLLTRMRLARLRLTRLSDSDTGLADFGPACTVSVARLTLASQLTLAALRILILTLAAQLKLILLTWTLVQLMLTPGWHQLVFCMYMHVSPEMIPSDTGTKATTPKYSP